MSARANAMLNAYRTGSKDRRASHKSRPEAYGARAGSAWADWYKLGYDGLPMPDEMKATGVEI